MKKILLALMGLMFYSTLMAQPAHVFKRFAFEPSLHYNPAIPSPTDTIFKCSCCIFSRSA